MWHQQRKADLQALIIRARDMDALDRIQRTAGHEFDAEMTAFMAKRVEVMKALGRRQGAEADHAI
jgi:hypothetical protein